MVQNEKKYEYWLASIQNLSDNKKHKLRKHMGSAKRAYYIEETELNTLNFLSEKEKNAIKQAQKELHPDFVIEKGMQENLIHCILHARRLLTLEEGLRWQDIKRYGIVIYRRYYEGYTLVNITDKMDTNDPRRAIQLPASVITAGMQPNPRND